MPADEEDLRAQVDDLLKRRPGWRLQAMATPGLPPVWAYGSGGQAELSVGTDGKSISVYVVEQDRDVYAREHERIGRVAQGVQPPNVQRAQGRVGEKPKRRRFLDWE